MGPSLYSWPVRSTSDWHARRAASFILDLSMDIKVYLQEDCSNIEHHWCLVIELALKKKKKVNLKIDQFKFSNMRNKNEFKKCSFRKLWDAIKQACHLQTQCEPQKEGLQKRSRENI